MKHELIKRTATIFLVLISIGASTAFAQTVQPGVSSRQVRTVLDRIRSGAINLQTEINRARYDDTANSADERVATQLSSLTSAVNNVRRTTSFWSRNTDVSSDLNTIMDSAGRINRVLSRNTTSARINSRWASMRTNINTLATYYGMTANWDTGGGWNNNNTGSNQGPQLRTSGAQVRNVLARLRSRAAGLRREINRTRYNDSANNADDRVSNNLDALIVAINGLNRSTYSYSSADDAGQVNTILDRSSRINRILSRNTTSTSVNRSWMDLRSNVDTLASYYGLTANWTGDNGNNDNTGGGNWNDAPWNDRVTGTYRLNASQSDNVSDVIGRSLGYYNANERDNQRRMLERRLASPEIIAFEKRGRSITMGSSNQAQVTFDADGVARTETNARGRAVTTRVTSTNNNLTIDYSGDRVNDFNVSFTADRSGRLRVTRRIYLENQNRTISVSSIYDRISQTADWSQIRQSNDPYAGTGTGSANGGFYIPNNVTLTATLRNPISTKVSQVGDRFTMDVTSPDQYRGAVIEGRIAETRNSGRVTGRANLQMDFDTVTMNGRTYQFAGFIQSVSAVNGDNVTINNEGAIRDNSQTNKTAMRAGIGAVLGAIIGAVAGGGSGAAIGAGVGAGAGAGSVLLGGRDSIELGAGSTFRILTSAPANVGYVPRN